MLINVSDFPNLRATLGDLPVDIVFDHMGHMPASKGIDDPGFQELLRMLDSGRCWVKASGAYRITAHREAPYPDVAPIARAIIAANPERVVWGTDWPHPFVHIPMPNDGDLLDLLDEWSPSTEVRDRILAENPKKLYQFED